MLIYQSLATDLCEPKEAQRLFEALAILPENMSADYFRSVARGCGFALVGEDKLDSEWQEYTLENGGENDYADRLLRLARMRRQQDELVEQHGRERFEADYFGTLWSIYTLLGKLCAYVFVLRKPT